MEKWKRLFEDLWDLFVALLDVCRALLSLMWRSIVNYEEVDK